MKMTANDAERLARILRALCIVRAGQILHVSGHVIGPLKMPKPKVIE